LLTRHGDVSRCGVVLCLSVSISAAGRGNEERELPEKKRRKASRSSTCKGLIVCTISGNTQRLVAIYGIEAGTPMAEAANSLWKALIRVRTTEFLYQNKRNLYRAALGRLHDQFHMVHEYSTPQ